MITLNSMLWADILSLGMGARTIHVDGSRPILIATFRVGPFSIAYPDFPVGAADYGREESELIFAACKNARVDMVRLHVHDIPPHLKPSSIHPLGTVQIDDLQTWEEQASKKARRTKNRIARSPIAVECSRLSDADRLYELYARTIKRNAGTIRYSRSYFAALAETGCLVAKSDDTIVGFVCYGILEKRACYLHGGHSPEVRSLYPSDILFRQMILDAKANGASIFDFLPSPGRQEGLQRYKAAWGGTEHQFFALDFHLNPVKARLFKYMKSAIDLIPQAMAERLTPGKARKE